MTLFINKQCGSQHKIRSELSEEYITQHSNMASAAAWKALAGDAQSAAIDIGEAMCLSNDFYEASMGH